MSRDFQQVEFVFLQLTECSAEERAEKLRELHATDPEICREVETLLQHHHAGGRFLADAGDWAESLVSFEEDDVAEVSLEPGTRFACYEIIRTLGSGGMGTVYAAHQPRPRRTVALKVIRPEIASPSLIRRFELEAEILGSLQHPGIAQIFEAGTAQAGGSEHPYIAMELVEGLPLTDFATQHRLSVDTKLDLFARICDAVLHAHQRGVIHRDLKPANILVAPSGEGRAPHGPGFGLPKILDFGIARFARSPVSTVHTSVGQLVGTLPYMSPEQLTGDPALVDSRTDVFALGIILFEILAHCLPRDVRNLSLPEAIHVIRHEEPKKLGRMDRRFRGELEIIAAKAMENNKELRYQSARDLAADVRRYLSGEPIDAKRQSAIYVLRKTIRRHRILVGSGIALIAILAVSTIVASMQATRNKILAEEATAQRTRADVEAENLRRSLYFSRIGFAQSALGVNDIERLKSLMDLCPQDLRDWEWKYLARLSDRSVYSAQVPGHGIWHACISGNRQRVAAIEGLGHLVVVQATTREMVLSVETGFEHSRLGLNFDGSRLAIGGKDGNITLLQIPSGENIVRFRHGNPTDTDRLLVRSLAVDPAGQRLVTGDYQGRLRLWDAATSSMVLELDSAACKDVAEITFSPTVPGLVAASCHNGWIGMWNLPDPTPRVIRSGGSATTSVSFSSDGQKILTAGLDDEFAVWDVRTGEKSASILEAPSQISVAAPLPGSEFVSGAGLGRELKTWSIVSRAQLQTLRGHAGAIVSVMPSGDGGQIITAGSDGMLKWWSTDTPPEVTLIPSGLEGVVGIALSPDDRFIAAVGFGPTANVWDARAASLVESLAHRESAAYAVAWHPSMKALPKSSLLSG